MSHILPIPPIYHTLFELYTSRLEEETRRLITMIPIIRRKRDNKTMRSRSGKAIFYESINEIVLIFGIIFR